NQEQPASPGLRHTPNLDSPTTHKVMNPRYISPTGNLTIAPLSLPKDGRPGTSRAAWVVSRFSFLIMLLCLTEFKAQAQSVRIIASQIRATVPAGVGFTNTFVITNNINVSTDIVSAVNFSVSGLPAGTGTTLTDTNGNALLSTTNDTNLVL